MLPDLRVDLIPDKYVSERLSGVFSVGDRDGRRQRLLGFCVGQWPSHMARLINQVDKDVPRLIKAAFQPFMTISPTNGYIFLPSRVGFTRGD